MPKLIVDAKVIGQKVLTTDIRQIDLWAPQLAKIAVPGQFVNVEVSRQVAPLLRRPLGIADLNREQGTITLIYRIIGDATKILAEACSGDLINIIGPLGKGFDLKAKKPLIVGGGLGLAPLVYLAKSFCPSPVDILIGGRTEKEVFWRLLFEDLCQGVSVTTDDGSYGTKGNVLALLPQMIEANNYDCIYVCGPEPMMKAVAKFADQAAIPCQISLEKYMACGLGGCLSCSCGGIGKRLKVCTDGPVFWSKEVTEW
ncbi:MAG TPA: dihydroorotate dehydrogenase electron transfer subunit [Candidatus Avacidaminococcus intestinavium]|uniref:Dihydroorotate dehydrogenase B (NAD(+)), electron transfer subunit n=1 Tax=Candidatus Avacidaminococcus intestinavium TaxID=2840684 RepID=A0A9D1SLM4_9FIRM|nr:dihydroorotate dehydrogenase electron transfer subunit [Candidatus Avacidaminococcus intestinavium]